jgi:prenyltransferase beta subunit
MGRNGFVLLGMMIGATVAAAQTPDEKKASVAFLRGLQTESGGFLPAPPSAAQNGKALPSLRATLGAVRALKYFGGEVPDRKACAQFVRSCFDPASGGFVNHPGLDKPDAIVTAVGVMAVVDLQMPRDPFVARAVKYLAEHAQMFEEIRMAAAGLEAVKERPAQADQWLEQLAKMQNADGTFGKGAATVRATGSTAAAVLRLGGKLANRAAVVEVLQKGQRPDGGYGKEEATESDLETCYRVVRALVMLKEKPADVEALRTFVAKCRNEDGGYGLAPRQKSSTSTTYFAAIVLHWLEEK